MNEPLTLVAQRVYRRMMALKLNPAALSKKAGLNPTYVRDLFESENASPRSAQLTKLAKALGCTADDLIRDADITETPDLPALPPLDSAEQRGIEFGGETYVGLPVHDASASAGPGGSNAAFPAILSRSLYRLDWLRTMSRASIDDLAVIQVAGDSMMPTLMNGDHVLVDRSVRAIRRDGLYVLAADSEVQVKRVSRDPRDRLLTIRSDNQVYETWTGVDEASVHIMGRVIWLGRSIGG